jgi:hypothetical protein
MWDGCFVLTGIHGLALGGDYAGKLSQKLAPWSVQQPTKFELVLRWRPPVPIEDDQSFQLMARRDPLRMGPKPRQKSSRSRAHNAMRCGERTQQPLAPLASLRSAWVRDGL